MTNDELVKILTPFCSTDETRIDLLKPYNQTIDNKRYATGTDGHIACIVEGSLDDDGPANAPRCNNLVAKGFWPAVVSPDSVTSVVSMADYRAWVATFPPPPIPAPIEPPKPCDECDGTGSVDCDCISCGDEHEAECGACDGKGVTGKAEKVEEVFPVAIYPVSDDPAVRQNFYCNGRYARMIADLPGDTFKIGGVKDGTQIFAQGDGWCLTLMGLLVVDDTVKFHFPPAKS